MLLEGLDHVSNRGGLLADGDIDANHVLALLVDDGVDANGGLARLTVTNDQLALATSNRNHCVNCNKTSLDRLMDGLALDNARGAELNRTITVCLDRALAVKRHTQRVHDTAKEVLAAGNLNDTARRVDLVVFFDSVGIAEQYGADFVFFKVLCKAVDGAPIGRNELQQLASHGVLQTVDTCNTVANLNYITELAGLDVGLEPFELLTQNLIDSASGNFRHLPLTSSRNIGERDAHLV